MKKILSVSVIAMLAVSPMMAFADPTCPGVDQGNCNSNVASSGPGANGYLLSQSATGDDTNVVTASYVKGAYNDAITKINKVAADAASGVSSGITNAAGSGLVANGSALDINLTTDGGLAITSDALNVVVDGSTVTKGTGGALQVGTISNANVASNAAIEQSKIANLTTDLGNKQTKLQNNETTPVDIDASVLTTLGPATGDNAADDTHLVTAAAVRSAIDSATGTATTGMVTVTGTQTLTNKTIDADDNTIADLELDNFKSGVVQTSVRATSSASDTSLASELAVATALSGKQGSLQNNATTPADINTQVLTTVGATGDDTHLVTEKAVRDAIDSATSGISGKQAQLQYDNSGTMTDVNTTVLTSVRADGTADDAHMVSEKAVRDALKVQRINILATWNNNTVTQTTLGTSGS